MTENEAVTLKRGDIQTDPDGSKWWISAVSFLNGKPNYSRILVGSYAYHAMVAEGIIEEDLEETPRPVRTAAMSDLESFVSKL